VPDPHELLDPDQRHQNQLYRIERRPCDFPVDDFGLIHRVVSASPPDHTLARRPHVSEPVGPIAKGERVLMPLIPKSSSDMTFKSFEIAFTFVMKS